jgi:hypothetical protein
VGVKPDALAGGAAINFDGFKGNFFHGRVAFWAC